MCFFQELESYCLSVEMGHFGKSWWSRTVITLRDMQKSLKMLTEFTILNKWLDPLASKINGSLIRPRVLLSFTCVLIHGNTERQTLFSSTASCIHMLIMLLDVSLLTLVVFCKELQCFYTHLKGAVFSQSWCSSTRKTLRGQQYSLKQQTQYKLQKKVLAPLASNIIVSLTLATLHRPFSCMGPLWTKVMFLTLENTER
jgi:hypothetical protein